MNKEPLFSFDEYDYQDEDWDLAQEDYNYVEEKANNLLDSQTNYYVKVVGTIRRWNGNREIETIISETKLQDIISKYLEPDRLSIYVYEDRVELSNSHHDGTNSYIFYPFSFNSLTKKELFDLMNVYDMDNICDYYNKPLSRLLKQDIVEFVENNNIGIN